MPLSLLLSIGKFKKVLTSSPPYLLWLGTNDFFVFFFALQGKQNKFVCSFFERIYGAPKLLLVLSKLSDLYTFSLHLWLHLIKTSLVLITGWTGSFLLSINYGTCGISTAKEKRNSLYKMNELQRQSGKPWSRKYAHAICKVLHAYLQCSAYFDFKLHNRFICHFLSAIRSKFLGSYATFLCYI